VELPLPSQGRRRAWGALVHARLATVTLSASRATQIELGKHWIPLPCRVSTLERMLANSVGRSYLVEC
jgi:hypothetical protein